jgi:hypothetical protein
MLYCLAAAAVAAAAAVMPSQVVHKRLMAFPFLRRDYDVCRRHIRCRSSTGLTDFLHSTACGGNEMLQDLGIILLHCCCCCIAAAALLLLLLPCMLQVVVERLMAFLRSTACGSDKIKI